MIKLLAETPRDQKIVDALKKAGKWRSIRVEQDLFEITAIHVHYLNPWITAIDRTTKINKCTIYWHWCIWRI